MHNSAVPIIMAFCDNFQSESDVKGEKWNEESSASGRGGRGKGGEGGSHRPDWSQWAGRRYLGILVGC